VEGLDAEQVGGWISIFLVLAVAFACFFVLFDFFDVSVCCRVFASFFLVLWSFTHGLATKKRRWRSGP
jgi:hypothetical protein